MCSVCALGDAVGYRYSGPDEVLPAQPLQETGVAMLQLWVLVHGFTDSPNNASHKLDNAQTLFRDSTTFRVCICIS